MPFVPPMQSVISYRLHKRVHPPQSVSWLPRLTWRVRVFRNNSIMPVVNRPCHAFSHTSLKPMCALNIAKWPVNAASCRMDSREMNAKQRANLRWPAEILVNWDRFVRVLRVPLQTRAKHLQNVWLRVAMPRAWSFASGELIATSLERIAVRLIVKRVKAPSVIGPNAPVLKLREHVMV